MEKDEKFQMPILNDLEDLEFQKSAYRYRFEIKFPELPEFMKKGLENISEKHIGKPINEIFPWLPQRPAFLRTVNKKTDEIADTRYLDCFLISLSEDKSEIIIETENFGFSDNPLITGRVKNWNLLFFPPEWTSNKEGKWVLKGTFFERNEEK